MENMALLKMIFDSSARYKIFNLYLFFRNFRKGDFEGIGHSYFKERRFNERTN